MRLGLGFGGGGLLGWWWLGGFEGGSVGGHLRGVLLMGLGGVVRWLHGYVDIFK